MPEITLTRPSVYHSEGVRLLPGVNTVSDADFAKLSRNKIVQADINAGTLVVGHEAKSAPAEKPKAEAVTDQTVDTAALVELAQGDGRTTEVREAREALEAMGIDWDE